MRKLHRCPVCERRFNSKEEMLRHYETHTNEEKTKLALTVNSQKSKPSNAWVLVPILFGILGGLIGYVGVKDDDKELANNLLIFGIVFTFIYALLIGIYYSWWLAQIF
ncbi:MAG: C2H2-type zinc finger protein [Candidatus Bathyarchaeota archaeon]|nr:C2H2-type zinc finger protein [Candidatus Bathyarchaeota archaeon]